MAKRNLILCVSTPGYCFGGCTNQSTYLRWPSIQCLLMQSANLCIYKSSKQAETQIAPELQLLKVQQAYGTMSASERMLHKLEHSVARRTLSCTRTRASACMCACMPLRACPPRGHAGRHRDTTTDKIFGAMLIGWEGTSVL